MLGKSPRLSLAEPHQRRFNDKRHIKPEIERHLEAFERSVAAVRIPRLVRLTHPSHEHPKPPSICERSGKRKKEEISPRDERIRQT